MEKIKIFIACIILCVFLFLNFVSIENKAIQMDNKIKTEVEQQLESMTLEEKIGQMLITYYRKETVDDQFKEELEKYQPSGFILFRENFTNYENTIQLIETIENTAKIPLFITIDQEGGRVQRLKELEDSYVTQIPSMTELGNTNNLTLAYDVGKVIAEELQVFGINMDFAPVLDIVDNVQNRVIGDRSFGSNADLVSKMGISLAKGLEDNGVIAVYKHFPGHGSTILDSHYDLPVIEKTKEELFSSDLVPFKRAIESGAEVIMIGHLAVPSITKSEIPASLSKELITGLLKQEMGYNGLIVTDALNMKALTNHYSEKDIYELAINAGVDLLLMPSSLEGAVTYIKQSVAEGKITEERINESVYKILTLKYKKLSLEKRDRALLGSESHVAIVKRVQP